MRKAIAAVDIRQVSDKFRLGLAAQGLPVSVVDSQFEAFQGNRGSGWWFGEGLGGGLLQNFAQSEEFHFGWLPDHLFAVINHNRTAVIGRLRR